MDTTTKFFLPAAVILAGLLIAGAVLWNGGAPAGNGGEEPLAVDISKVDIAGDPFIGNAEAPVTIAVWSDYQCPFCKNFEVGTLPQIVEKYVDTGKVKIVFMDFAFLGNDSDDAAAYSRAVWKLYPQQYSTWREAMYAAQDDEGDRGFGDAASIDTLTSKIAGIDSAKVAADVQANRAAYLALSDADREEALKFGINATPSFIIGTQTIKGAYPYATFEAAIEEALK